MDKVLVIGASNIDYSAISKNSIIEGDSNIGNIKITYGGVGRNIVENLAHFDCDVTFLTFIGKDTNGENLKKELTSFNVKVINPDLNESSSSYIAIYDKMGEMKVAICDTAILDNCKRENIYQYKELIDSFEIIVLDANINEDILNWLFLTFNNKKIIVEAVSANKVKRFRNYLNKIYLFKSNLLEARYLFDKHNESNINLAKELMKLGTKNVVITNGSAPVIIGENNDVVFITPKPMAKIINVSGAGDSLLAGIIYGLINNKSLVESVAFGIKVSQKTLTVESSVDKNIGELKKSLK